MTSRIDGMRRAVASYGLDDATAMLPRGMIDAATWPRFLAAIARDRTTGHLIRAVSDRALPTTTTQTAAVVDAHERALARDLLLERLLLRAVAALDDAGIPLRVLKGAAVAHTVYPNPDLRSFGDADLLVPGRRFDDAVAALRRSGATRRYSEPRPGFDARFGKGVCVVQPDGWEIDLHRAFVAGPFGLAMDPDELFLDSTPFELGGRTLHGLDAHARFVHACFHAALGSDPPRLAALRDVAQMALHTELDGALVADLGDRWRCGIVLQRAIHLTWTAFGVRVEPPVVRDLRRHRPSRFERRALAAYLGPHRSYARQAVAGLRAVRGLRAKAAYTGALLFPTSGYLGAREGGRARRLARAAGLLRRTDMQR